MSKYSCDFKLMVVEEFLEGTSSYNYIADKYNIPSKSLVYTWVNQFEQYGERGLKKEMKRKKYSGEFKLHVIEYRHINMLSYKETANHFEIRHPSTIALWQQRYEEEGIEGLNRPNRRRQSMPRDNDKTVKKLTETEREELIRLREENEFLKMRQEYEKKLRALVQRRERKTKRKL